MFNDILCYLWHYHSLPRRIPILGASPDAGTADHFEFLWDVNKLYPALYRKLGDRGFEIYYVIITRGHEGAQCTNYACVVTMRVF